MPRDGAGVYTLPVGNPVVTNTIIASTWANTTLSDIAAQLNNVLTRDGLLGPTGPFKLQDGTVAAPGLAWASESGLGWFRRAASQIGIASQGALGFLMSTDVATAASFNMYPRTAGASTIVLANGPITAANYSAMTIASDSAAGHIVREVLVGTATAKPLLMTFPAGIDADLSPTLKASHGMGFNWTGTSNFLGMGNGFGGYSFLFEPSIGKLTWLNAGGGSNFFSDSAGNFVVRTAISANGGGVSMLQDATYNFLSMQSNSGAWSWRWHRTTGSLEWVNGTGVQLLGFDPSGNAAKASGAGPWNGVSDVRIKENIRDYTTGLDAVLALRPVWFNYIEGASINTDPHIALIAQECMIPMPETVIVAPGRAGDVEYDDLHTLDVGPVTYALINSIKTLHERLTHLESLARTA